MEEQSIAEFVERMQVPIAKLGVAELRQREAHWRALWSWLDEECKYYLLRIGSVVRIVKRDYKGSTGELGAVKFKLDEVELTVFEKSYNYQDGKYYYETKVVKIPSGTIMMQEFILDSQVAADIEEPEVMGLEAIGDVV